MSPDDLKSGPNFKDLVKVIQGHSQMRNMVYLECLVTCNLTPLAENLLLSVCTWSDGDMFSASQYDFRSTPDVRRNFPFPVLRTEEAPTRWLLGKQNKELGVQVTLLLLLFAYILSHLLVALEKVINVWINWIEFMIMIMVCDVIYFICVRDVIYFISVCVYMNLSLSDKLNWI